MLVSLSGLTGRALRPDEARAPMPELAALAGAGARADVLEPVAPASLRPTHAALVSGRLSSRHGVVGEWWPESREPVTRGAATFPVPREPTLLGVVAARGLAAAAFAWPGVRGDQVARYFPEIGLASAVPPGTPAALGDGAERDAEVVTDACRALAQAPPALLLLRLGQAGEAARVFGPSSDEVRAALGGADAELARLVRCTETAGLLGRTAFVVAGDHGFVDLHTRIDANVALARAGLATPSGDGSVAPGARAVARASGGSAFVYARREEDALIARRALEQAAAETQAFRVTPADELIRRGTDPEAWFGLEAEPGFAFGGSAVGPLVRAAAERGVGGYLAPRRADAPAFVAFGCGVRPRTRIPRMRQVDVAPTIALLLGLSLGDADGRAVVGLVSAAAPATAPAAASAVPQPAPSEGADER